MQVKKTQLVPVLAALGFADASNWPDAKLLAKGNKFGKLPEKELEKLTNPKMKAGVKAWITKLQAGESMSLEGTAAPAKGGKAAPAKKEKAAKEPKGPGVIATIVECLTKASKTNPVTKDTILAKLVEKFPERGEAQMKTTMNIQLPTRLREQKSLNIIKSDKGGYYIEK